MSTTRCEFLKFARLLVAVLAFALWPRAARAQENREAAKPLFEEARRLLAAGKYQEACAKLEETRKLYAGAGVLLNLGDCYEHLGRTGSAWDAFTASAAAASRSGRSEEEAEANRRRNLLSSRVSHFVVHVVNETAGLVVTRDGSVVDRSAWGQPLTIDPGPHEIRADAAGFHWQTRISVPDSAQTITVDVPELQEQAGVAPPSPVPSENRPGPQASTTPPTNTGTRSTGPSSPEAPLNQQQQENPPASSSARGQTQRLLAFVLLGAGGVGLAVGGVMGLIAKSKYNTAQGEGVGRHADSVSAVDLGNAGTAVVIAGSVLAASGIVLWLTAPRSRTQVGWSGCQLLVSTQF
jgi:hypothetical protein